MTRKRPVLAAAAALAACLAAVPVAASGKAPVTSGPASPALGIRHVFVVVIENEGFAKTFTNNPNPYLGKALQKQGTVLTKYYGIGHESNPNYIAMISGQAPNPMTQSDCQSYVDFEPSPAVLDPRGNGQAVGQGCVFPPNVATLADQLTAKHVSWRGYMGDMGNDLSREADRCGQPSFSAGTGFRDGTQSASATDQYAARHNPFVYFHSLVDSGACERDVVPLTHLTGDLARTSTTPQFSFIVPNLCDDGHDAPCTGKDATGSNAGGLTSVDHFLSTYVPKIEASPAFGKDGLLLILADESDGQDATSCCGETFGPNSPFPGIYPESGNGQGGGLVGALAIGRCVRPGATDATPYNHYSLLRSLEDLYGVTTGGADGKGHLGMAGAAGLASFGPDLFASCSHRKG
ncbi:MAG: phosphatidylinositol-3-phosphatase [Frankiaceae bacterium]|nr:phosphatidylinositol-3-phosphatase [Frankiaceae bacterium]